MILEGIHAINRRTGAGVPGCMVVACDQGTGRSDIRGTDGDGNHRGWNFSGAAISYAVIPPAGYENAGGGMLTADANPLEIVLDPR